MKRNLGYSMREAEKVFFDSCDGTHELNLIEVFERRGPEFGAVMVDVERHDPTGRTGWGELWLCDEDGMNAIVADGWDYEPRERIGHSRAERIEMKEDES